MATPQAPALPGMTPLGIPEERPVTLTLTKAEATTLRSWLAMAGGSPSRSPRRVLARIDQKLAIEGVRYYLGLLPSVGHVYLTNDNGAICPAAREEYSDQHARIYARQVRRAIRETSHLSYNE